MRIIAGRFRSRLLQTPKGSSTRPTTGKLREAVFNICQSHIEGAQFLDLFAGSGAMGLEGLSRGASSAVFIDNNAEAVRCLRSNIDSLGVQDQTTVINGDVLAKLKLLEKRGSSFDIIYVDPPYAMGVDGISYSEKILRSIDEGALLLPGGVLFIEESIEAAPNPLNLKILAIKKSRNFGHSILQQYERLH